MGLTVFSDIKDSFDISLSGDSVNYYGYQDSDNCIHLPQVPKVSDGTMNHWSSLEDAQLYISSIDVYNGSTWDSLTLTTVSPPSSDGAFLHISEAPLSNRIYVDSSHRGKQFHIQYIGIGTLVSSFLLNQAYTAIHRLEDGIDLHAFSWGTYSSGRFDDSEDNNKKFRLTSCKELFLSKNGSFNKFNGVDVDCGVGGNGEILAFSNANYWKRCLFCIDYDNGWNVTKIESDEQESQTSLLLPDVPSDINTLCYVDVQNNGTTGSNGEILPITQSNIVVYKKTQFKTLHDRDVVYSGYLQDDELFDHVFSFGYPGKIVKFVLNAGDDSGASGQTILNIFKHTPGDDTGTSVFDTPANQPTIDSSDGSYAIDITPQGDFNQDELEFTGDTTFRIMIENAAIGAKDFRGTLWVQLLHRS